MSAGTTRLADVVEDHTRRMLNAYREQPGLVKEHAGLEENLSQGGYGRRQLLELIQNGADQLREEQGGRIQVVLTEDYLYCANQGQPISADGIAAILLANISPKRDDEIGRFGLGFKSVLGISDRPEFFSEEVSFGFDQRWAADEIRATVGEDFEAYPTLRLASTLDLDAARQDDEVLDELMHWATTVVRVPLTRTSGWLAEDIETFDPAFLLFSPHVVEVVLENRPTHHRTTVTMAPDGDDLLLSVGGETSRWRVFETRMAPSERAREESGKLQHRESLPIVWAVPLDGRNEDGRFWAFFPLRDATTLTGIANAPWQINDDRTGLLEHSTLNNELIEALVDLALDSLPELRNDEDPGRILDYTPSRGAEKRCWGDGVLSELFNSRRRDRAIVPAVDGGLHRITELHAPPDISAEAQAAWAEHRNCPTDWIHPSAARSNGRRSRIRSLMELAGVRPETDAAWLESLVASDDSDAHDSAEAIKVAARAVESAGQRHTPNFREAEVVLNNDETWSRLDPAWIWVDNSDHHREPAVVVVHDDVASHLGVKAALSRLGIQPVTPLLEVEALLGEADGEADWEQVWEIAREIEDLDAAAARFRKDRSFRVRTVDGRWVPSTDVLLPGRVVSDPDRAPSVIVDATYHEPDLSLLRQIGLSDVPQPGGSLDDDDFTKSWRDTTLERYLEFVNSETGRSPQPHLLRVKPDEVPRPLGLLRVLRGDDSVRFVQQLLGLQGALDERTAHHTNPGYPTKRFGSPVVAAVKRWGRLATSRPTADSTLGARPVSDCVGPELAEYGDVLPVADTTAEAAAALELHAVIELVPTTLWKQTIVEALESSDSKQLGAVLQLAQLAGITPITEFDLDGIRVGTDEIVVATDRDDLRALTELRPHVAVVRGDVARPLCERWGTTSASDLIRIDVRPVGESEPTAATALFPGLEDVSDDFEQLQVVVCDEIVVERSDDLGTSTETTSSSLEGDTLYLVADPDDSAQLLYEITQSKEVALDLNRTRELIANRDTGKAVGFLEQINATDDLDEKLLLAVGRDALAAKVPRLVMAEIEERRGRLSDADVAELAHVIHGVEVLSVHREDLDANGLRPPERWAGASRVRRFVLSLGFPESYAGFRSQNRDSLLQVVGPPAMPPLHDFQRHAADEIRAVLARGKGRGMLSLPTGAGKTRTAVHAVIESFRDDGLAGPVLWIAESDELCEQAVTAWADQWRAHGPRSTLNIGRLWGNNRATDLRDPHHVVVTTRAKLTSIIDNHADDYAWLSEASVVIVDEAHRAITPSYTKILTWLGLGRKRQRVPLIGLSATPFRGTSAEQTQALVDRFDRKRFDDMGEDPYGELQDMGILSHVEHQLLAGTSITLTDREREELDMWNKLPQSVLDRVGEDQDRNQAILDSVLALDESSTVLLFAASVTHAELLAALLSVEGVASRAISGRTERGPRRHYIEQFREGDLRVLTNFGVLTEGFDAPAVDAVYVARPTYSPNLYQQMIGRGLRGPKNGGKKSCLIVNVEDNLVNYGSKLAFHEFDDLWQR